MLLLGPPVHPAANHLSAPRRRTEATRTRANRLGEQGPHVFSSGAKARGTSVSQQGAHGAHVGFSNPRLRQIVELHVSTTSTSLFLQFVLPTGAHVLRTVLDSDVQRVPLLREIPTLRSWRLGGSTRTGR